jgi:CheY-like chemotaxis protein
VLFVEDDHRLADVLWRLLEADGFRVDHAPTGETGLVLARGGQYDVILLDLMLPVMSGIDLLRRLRVEGIRTPVVVLTGRGTFDSALEAGRLGASAYLRKPALDRDLMTALRAAAGTPSVSQYRSALFAAEGRTSRSIEALVQHLQGPPDLDRERLGRLLVNTACARQLTFLEFIAIARAIRLLSSRSNPTAQDVVSAIQEWIEEASKRGGASAISHLQAILSHLEAAGKNWSGVTEKTIERELGIEVARTRPLLSEEFGVTFVKCRRAVLMRNAAIKLSWTTDHVRQIAFQLGYSDAGNFDHDFRSFFGLTPTSFRRHHSS